MSRLVCQGCPYANIEQSIEQVRQSGYNTTANTVAKLLMGTYCFAEQAQNSGIDEESVGTIILICNKRSEIYEMKELIDYALKHPK